MIGRSLFGTRGVVSSLHRRRQLEASWASLARWRLRARGRHSRLSGEILRSAWAFCIASASGIASPSQPLREQAVPSASLACGQGVQG